jgi:hypothetical protein
MARAEKEDTENARDAEHAQKQMAVLHTSIKSILERIYRIMSHSFHVLLMDLIPHARHDRSNLFTHIKGARTDHILALRAHHGKKRDGLPDLEGEELVPHSAKHTLQFLEDEYVEKDDDAAHYTWGDILTATRAPKTSLFTWVDSFTLLTLRYGETIDRISAGRQTKVNKVIAKQITDDEKLTIATLKPELSSLKILSGTYVFAELVKLLAQNVTSFTKRYTPLEHPRIMKYLRTRASRQVVTPTYNTAAPKGKGGKGSVKRLKVAGQRGWTLLQETLTGPIAPAPDQPRGKGKGKPHDGKGKTYESKGKGKSFSKGKGKGKMKGSKGKRNPKGKFHPKGTMEKGLTPFVKVERDLNHGHLKCHFCHTIGHIKPNCRKWLALQTSDTYNQRKGHEPKYQLIYDHLEDSILAPRSCQYCSDEACDGTDCESPFDYDDYNEASLFFTQTLSPLVWNAKLERPLESHAPQTEQMYAYDDDDWGDAEEDYSQSQWAADEWESSDQVEQHEAYAYQNEYEPQDQEKEAAQESDEYDEDDQDNYE